MYFQAQIMWRSVLGLFFLKVVLASDHNWWKNTEIYEIFIPSFQDSDGDGYGDLKGITSRADYLEELKIGAIWLTPFFKSPMLDNGYDISNFTDVDPLFGNLADFEELSQEMKKRGIKIFMDFVINHSSDQHPWFLNSIEGIQPYSDFYIWKDPKGFDMSGHPIPPNNWLSLFGGSAWKWNQKRRQFYLHQFAEHQPDLNLRNTILKQELKNVLKFWFDRGVTALRMDAVMQYIEDSLFRDEPPEQPEIKKEEYGYEDLLHIYTADLWESYAFLHELRLFIDDINVREGGPERIMVAEVYTNPKATLAYYGTKDYPIAHFPFNTKLALNYKFRNATALDYIINSWLRNMPEGGVANWVTDNHDINRSPSRLTDEYSDIMNVLVMMLPGVAVLYYGQEMGLPDGPVRPDQIQNPYGRAWPRDPTRTPMQWDDSLNAGFTSKLKSWLPVNPNYWNLNVEAQKMAPNSRLKIFKTLSYIRKTKTIKHGQFKSYVLSTWVFAFTRTLAGQNTYLVVINLGTEMEMVNLGIGIKSIPPLMKVVTGSLNSGHRNGEIVYKNSRFPKMFVLKPLSFVVLTNNLKETSVGDAEDS